MNIGNKIKKIRIGKNLTQEEIAFRLEISLSAYSNLERNVTAITLDKIEKLSKILGVSIIEILAFDEEEKINKEITRLNLLLKAKEKELEAKDKEIAKKDKVIINLQKELIASLKKGK